MEMDMATKKQVEKYRKDESKEMARRKKEFDKKVSFIS